MMRAVKLLIVRILCYLECLGEDLGVKVFEGKFAVYKEAAEGMERNGNGGWPSGAGRQYIG
jgi:hypothetical protein